MTRRNIASSVLGAAAAAAIGFATTTASAQEVKFGMFTPLTGTSSVVGLDMLRGVQMAIDAVNAGVAVPMTDGTTMQLGPGVLGGQINLIVEDAESRPQGAMDAVRKLVTVDQVAVVLGEYSSGRTLPTGQFTTENGVPHISIGANSPLLRDVGTGGYFFNAIGLAGLQGYALVDMAVAELEAGTIATLFPNNAWGVGVEAATCEAATAAGIPCTAVRYEEQKTDYRAELRQVMASSPDTVIFFAYGADAILILRQAFELGIDVAGTWLAAEMSNWTADVAPTPEIGEGIRGIEHAVAGELYETAYHAPYVAAFGEEPLTVFGAFGYDAAMIAALAVELAGTTDHDAVRDAIRVVAETYQGVTGNLAFDEDGMRLVQAYGTFIYQSGVMTPYTPMMP
ncbi:MAG: ABC transporter substrate-binding protein [Bauldia sp.]|nr:ABC transporter substrate-binding protein [Bauldia sp.]